MVVHKVSNYSVDLKDHLVVIADTEPLHPDRAELFDKLRLGELEPDEAEALAATRGLSPLLKLPDAAKYDVRSAAVWSYLMVVAWVIARDLNEVRLQWDAYRLACRQWKKWGPRARPSWTLVAWPRAVFDCSALQSWAFDKLRSALLHGKLVATGIDRYGQRIPIPCQEWQNLRPCVYRDRAALVLDYACEDCTYSEVTLLRADVLSFFSRGSGKDEAVFQSVNEFFPELADSLALNPSQREELWEWMRGRDRPSSVDALGKTLQRMRQRKAAGHQYGQPDSK